MTSSEDVFARFFLVEDMIVTVYVGFVCIRSSSLLRLRLPVL